MSSRGAAHRRLVSEVRIPGQELREQEASGKRFRLSVRKGVEVDTARLHIL